MATEPNIHDDTAAAPPGVSAWARRIFVLARLLFGGTAFVAFLGFFARWSPFAEMTVHFRVLYACFAALAVLLAVITRQRALTALSAALLVWALGGIVPWYMGAHSSEPRDGTPLRVLTANVSLHNQELDKLSELFRSEDPDLVFLQETNAAWFAALRDVYPHRVEVPHRHYFGLALYSRFPIQNAQYDDPADGDVPLLRADIDVNGCLVHVVNLHIPSPEARGLMQVRLTQYEWLAEHVSDRNGGIIVAGDFNGTMWSPLFSRVVKGGGLANARDGYGILPTWFPLGGSLHLLPLDHVLVGGLSVANTRLGESIGSDHNPLIVDLVLPPC